MKRIDENVIEIDGHFTWSGVNKKFLLSEGDDFLYDFWPCPSVKEAFSHPSRVLAYPYKMVIIKDPDQYEVTIRRKDETEKAKA